MEEVPPVRYAAETVALVNRELSDVIAQYTTDGKRPNTNPLSMRLQVSISVELNGNLNYPK